MYADLKAILETTFSDHDDPVWTNVAYPLSAIGAWGHHPEFFVMLGAGLVLGLSSAAYHATYTRPTQRADVATMMMYLVALLVALVPLSAPSKWLVVPVAGGLYWRYAWAIDTYVHVPLFAAAIGGVLVAQVGWAAAWPLSLFGVGGTIKVWDPGADTALHSLWHILGGAATYLALALVM